MLIKMGTDMERIYALEIVTTDKFLEIIAAMELLQFPPSQFKKNRRLFNERKVSERRCKSNLS